MLSFVKIAAIILFHVILLGSSNAQQPSITEPTLLNSPTIAKPKAARETGLGGSVSVLVKIDENGNVQAASDALGPDWVCPNVGSPDVIALRNSAIYAAFSAKFEPKMVDGKPVPAETRVSINFPSDGKRSGVMTINHRLPSDILDKEANLVPLPDFPPAAVSVKASGPVGLQILIEMDGTVISAEPVSGHPLLRTAARNAACKAKFKPTLISGKPVRVTGSIVYNFIPN